MVVKGAIGINSRLSSYSLRLIYSLFLHSLALSRCGNKSKRLTAQHTLQWRLNGRDGDSNLQPHDCLLNRLFRLRSKKTSKLRVTGFVQGIHRSPVNSPHKWPVTRKMFPFDVVIMYELSLWAWIKKATWYVHIANGSNSQELYTQNIAF